MTKYFKVSWIAAIKDTKTVIPIQTIVEARYKEEVKDVLYLKCPEANYDSINILDVEETTDVPYSMLFKSAIAEARKLNTEPNTLNDYLISQGFSQVANTRWVLNIDNFQVEVSYIPENSVLEITAELQEELYHLQKTYAKPPEPETLIVRIEDSLQEILELLR